LLPPLPVMLVWVRFTACSRKLTGSHVRARWKIQSGSSYVMCCAAGAHARRDRRNSQSFHGKPRAPEKSLCVMGGGCNAYNQAPVNAGRLIDQIKQRAPSKDPCRCATRRRMTQRLENSTTSTARALWPAASRAQTFRRRREISVGLRSLREVRLLQRTFGISFAIHFQPGWVFTACAQRRRYSTKWRFFCGRSIPQMGDPLWRSAMRRSFGASIPHLVRIRHSRDAHQFRVRRHHNCGTSTGVQIHRFPIHRMRRSRISIGSTIEATNILNPVIKAVVS
jgi:hypothetical protein